MSSLPHRGPRAEFQTRKSCSHPVTYRFDVSSPTEDTIRSPSETPMDAFGMKCEDKNHPQHHCTTSWKLRRHQKGSHSIAYYSQLWKMWKAGVSDARAGRQGHLMPVSSAGSARQQYQTFRYSTSHVPSQKSTGRKSSLDVRGQEKNPQNVHSEWSSNNKAAHLSPIIVRGSAGENHRSKSAGKGKG